MAITSLNMTAVSRDIFPSLVSTFGPVLRNSVRVTQDASAKSIDVNVFAERTGAEFTQSTGSYTATAASTSAITVTLTSAEALSSGFATLQVVLPITRLESAVPVANNGDLVTVEHSFTVLDGQVAAQPLYVVLRTSDAAI